MLIVVPSTFAQCLEPVSTLISECCSEARPFRRLSNHLFRSQYFWKKLGWDTHLFLPNFLNLMHISEMQERIQKISFVFEVMALQVIA